MDAHRTLCVQIFLVNSMTAFFSKASCVFVFFSALKTSTGLSIQSAVFLGVLSAKKLFRTKEAF